MSMRITSLAFTLALIACSQGHRIDEGRESSGTTFSTADAEASPPLPDVETPLPEPQVTAEDTPTAERPAPAPTPEPLPDAEMDPDDENNNKTAMEPVPIGGAYLTCRYQNGSVQGSEDYRMDCSVAPAKDVSVAIVSAAFYKVDAQGNRSPLKVITQNLLDLQWTVQESVTTMGQNQVQVVLSVPGLLAATLTTTVSSTLNLAQNPVFWLGGEPNNLMDGEDCVEFVSANGKIGHQNFSGVTSGPLGRMNDISCNSSYRFLCRNISAGANAAKWTASPQAAVFAEGAQACSPGYAFGFPLNTEEVREVMSLVDRLDIRVWVNMNDRTNENIFSVKFR